MPNEPHPTKPHVIICTPGECDTCGKCEAFYEHNECHEKRMAAAINGTPRYNGPVEPACYPPEVSRDADPDHPADQTQDAPQGVRPPQVGAGSPQGARVRERRAPLRDVQPVPGVPAREGGPPAGAGLDDDRDIARLWARIGLTDRAVVMLRKTRWKEQTPVQVLRGKSPTCALCGWDHDTHTKTGDICFNPDCELATILREWEARFWAPIGLTYRAVAMLRKLERVYYQGDLVCPKCHGDGNGADMAHDPNCELAAILREWEATK